MKSEKERLLIDVYHAAKDACGMLPELEAEALGLRQELERLRIAVKRMDDWYEGNL